MSSLRNFCAKFLILPFVAFNTLAANAAVYKYTFATTNYQDSNAGGIMDGQGDLSGFFLLDTSLVSGDANYLAQNVEEEIALPNWITYVSITYTPDPGSGNSSYTKTNTSGSAPIDLVFWEVANSGTFDPSANNFVDQMTALSFGNGSRLRTSFRSLTQEYSFTDNSGNSIGAEYTLVDPVNPVQVPGPLPLLGLAPLAYYFRKLKRSLKNN